MKYFIDNIQKFAKENIFFRKVIFTGQHLQLVLMHLAPGEEIGEEVHNNLDQFFKFEEGEGRVIINGEEFEVKDDFAVVVPAGAKHNVINTSQDQPLKIYTIYSPPNHPEDTIHETKTEADEAEHHH